jgi:polyhydroxyalkanoate synthesis regulator phasin
MRQDAWRAYLEMALGVTEASRKKAVKAARKLVGRSDFPADQIQGLADDLLRASAANREAVTRIVRTELDRALGAVGLAKADELAELRTRVRELEEQLRLASENPSAAPAGTGGDEAVLDETSEAAAAARRESEQARVAAAAEFGAVPQVLTANPARRTVAKKAPAKKAVAKKAVATKAVSSGVAATVAKKVVAKKVVAKKAPAKKAAAKKAAPAGDATP